MRTGTIYGLICPIENKVLYVGQTFKSLEKRLCEHKAPKQCWRKSRLNLWLTQLHEQGQIKNLNIVPLESNVCESIIDEREMFAINLFLKSRPLMNTKGTGIKLKYRMSEPRALRAKVLDYPFDEIQKGEQMEINTNWANRQRVERKAKYYAKRKGITFQVARTVTGLIIQRIN